MNSEQTIFQKYNLIEYLAKSTFVTLLTTSIIGLFPIILAQFYSSSTIGKLTFLITSVSVIRTFSGFGMSSLLIRTFANKKDEIPLRATVIIFSVSSVILLMIATWYNLEFFNVEFLLKIALPMSLIGLLAAALQGLNYYNIAHFLHQSAVQSILLMAIFIGMFTSSNFSIQKIINISAFISLIIALYCLYLIVKSLKNSDRKFSKSIISNVKKSNHMFFFSTFYLILSATDQFIILYYSDYEHLGNYAMAVGLSAFAAIGIVIVNSFTPALFAQLKDDIPELNKIAFFSSYMGIWLSLIATICAAAYLYFGIQSEYKYTISVCFVILVLGNLFHTITGSAGFMCHMTGLEAQSSKVAFFSALTNLIIGLALVPYFGIIGAAIGTAIALMINKILLSYVAYKYLGMKSSFLYKHLG